MNDEAKDFIKNSNSETFIRDLLLLIISAYKNDPESIGSYGKNCKIFRGVKFLKLVDDKYSGKDKVLCEKYNVKLEESETEKTIYYYRKKGKESYVPVIINFQDLEKLGIIDEIKIRDRFLYITVDKDKLRELALKAKNNQLEDPLFSKEIIQRLREAYDYIKLQEDELNTFITTIRDNSDFAYLDILKSLINLYKNNSNDKELNVCSTLLMSVPDSQYERRVKLFNSSKIDSNDMVIYYPITINAKPKKTINYIPVLISDLMEKIQEDLPKTSFKLYENDYKSYYLETKVNTLEFESLLISIQNPKEQVEKVLK